MSDWQRSMKKVYPTIPYKLKRVGSTCWPAWKHPLNYYKLVKGEIPARGVYHAYLRNDGVSGFLVPLLSAIGLVATSNSLTEQRGPAQVLGFAIEVAWRRSRGEVLPARGRQLEASLVAKQLGDHAEGLLPDEEEPVVKKVKTRGQRRAWSTRPPRPPWRKTQSIRPMPWRESLIKAGEQLAAR